MAKTKLRTKRTTRRTEMQISHLEQVQDFLDTEYAEAEEMSEEVTADAALLEDAKIANKTAMTELRSNRHRKHSSSLKDQQKASRAKKALKEKKGYETITTKKGERKTFNQKTEYKGKKVAFDRNANRKETKDEIAKIEVGGLKPEFC